MRVEDLVLVSIDAHVIEPRDMFDSHVPAKYQAEAPKSIMDENGFEKWWFQGVASGSGCARWCASFEAPYPSTSA